MATIEQIEDFFESRGYSALIDEESAEIGGKTPKYGLDEYIYIRFKKPEDATDWCFWGHAIEDAADRKRNRINALEYDRDDISHYEIYKDQQAFDEKLSELWFDFMRANPDPWTDNGGSDYWSMDDATASELARRMEQRRFD